LLFFVNYCIYIFGYLFIFVFFLGVAFLVSLVKFGFIMVYIVFIVIIEIIIVLQIIELLVLFGWFFAHQKSVLFLIGIPILSVGFLVVNFNFLVA